MNIDIDSDSEDESNSLKCNNFKMSTVINQKIRETASRSLKNQNLDISRNRSEDNLL